MFFRNFWDLRFAGILGFVGSPGTLEERDCKKRVLGETTSFMALLWCALCFMQDRKVQRLQFHNLLHRPREDLITRNLRMTDHEK